MEKRWDCNKAFNGDSKGNQGNFLHLFQSRIDAWKRNYFPLDIINKLIKDYNSKRDWKKHIYERIYVLASDKKYYNIVRDVDTISFEESEEEGLLSVFMTLKENNKKLRVFTPCAFEEPKPMNVSDPGNVSIDHVIPLYMIVNQILRDNPTIRKGIETVIKEKIQNPKLKPKEIAEMIKDDVDSQLLQEFKNKVLEDTYCILMEQSENSKKSNVTPFIKYRKKDENNYILIMAEHVVNPDNQKMYTVYKTLDTDHHILSHTQMIKED